MNSKYLIANWKMNTPVLPVWMQPVALACVNEAIEVVLCPPFTQLAAAQMVTVNTPVYLGAQDCHAQEKGAYTGSVSADMVKRAGCSYVIVGHSERRAQCGEDDKTVRAKAEAAINSGLVPVICVGESEAERDSGKAEQVVAQQVAACVPEGEVIVAYEPVWAIGSGRIPQMAEIIQMHAAIKAEIKKHLHKPAPVVYGGSVTPANAAEILAADGVDGVLVGGASLDGTSFAQIIAAANAG